MDEINTPILTNPPVPSSITDTTPATPTIYNYASIGERFVAQIIDAVFWFFVIGFVIAKLFDQTTDGGFNLSGAPAFLFFGLAFMYFILFEALMGATIGKKIIKFRVVN